MNSETVATTDLAVCSGPPPTAVAIVEEPLTVECLVQQVKLIQEVMSQVMRSGEHYGRVPGAKKDCLFKSGAEKLFMTFKIAPEHDVEDLSTDTVARYRVKARAISVASGRFLGEGVGECSSAEDKYAWRAIRSEEEWEATPERDRHIKYGMSGNRQTQAKCVRTNVADQANTVLKMAKKRADVDACLSVTAASDIFTQDLEDQVAAPGAAPVPAGTPPPSASAPPSGASPAPTPTASAAAPATKVEFTSTAAVLISTTADLIRAALVTLGQTEETLLTSLRSRGATLESLESLTQEQADSLLAKLKEKVQALAASA